MTNYIASTNNALRAGRETSPVFGSPPKTPAALKRNDQDDHPMGRIGQCVKDSKTNLANPIYRAFADGNSAVNCREFKLTFNEATELLSTFFPKENWTWLLTKNLHGLMEESPTIPFNMAINTIDYDIHDLARFIVLYSQGRWNISDVDQMLFEFFDEEDLDRELEELLGAAGSWNRKDDASATALHGETFHV